MSRKKCIVINVLKGLIFADLSKWDNSIIAYMTKSKAELVDTLQLHWSMRQFIYDPAGKQILNLSDHYIMVANTYNCLKGFVTERDYKKSLRFTFYIEPRNESIYKEVARVLPASIKRCANRQLATTKRPSLLKPEDLTYSKKNIKFLSNLFDIIITKPKERIKDLINAILNNRELCTGTHSNFGFLTYLQRIIDLYFNSLKIELTLNLTFSGGKPKCFGPNDSRRDEFDSMSIIKICKTCYNMVNIYLCKGFNRAKIYSDPLLGDKVYSCGDKSCDFLIYNLIYYTDSAMYYPEIVYIVNKKTRYCIQFNADKRTSCNINVYKRDGDCVNHINEAFINSQNNNSAHVMTCLDYDKPYDFKMCDGCKIFLHQQQQQQIKQ